MVISEVISAWNLAFENVFKYQFNFLNIYRMLVALVAYE